MRQLEGIIIAAESPRLDGGEFNSSMSKREPAAPVALQPRAAGTTLHSWLYDELRAAILQRRLSPGLKLPSRSALARQCRVSIRTVVAVSEKLIAHGYLDARRGSGTYVRGAPADAAQNREPGAPSPPRVRPRALSDRGRVLAAQPFPRLLARHSLKTFGLDHLAPDTVAVATWNRLAGEHLRRVGSLELLAHGQPLGFPPLRRALADHVARTRGVRCDADQVVVTSGTQHSLDLITRLLLDPGDHVWMEDPGYAPATSLLRSHGTKVLGVPVDTHGLDCAVGTRSSRLAHLAYVTPGCQFPLGVVMSHERRLQLLQWATEAGAWVFEDDCDSLLRSDGGPQALHSLDRGGSVIYSNSLDSLLFPSLRLGFLVLPPAFVEPAAAALSITQRYQPSAEQAVLADFIVQGHLDEHLQRMRELYAQRHDTLVQAARADLGGLMQISNSPPGRRVIGWLSPDLDEAEAWRRATARQIDSVALATLTIDRSMPPGLLFGIGAADTRAIRTAIRRLGRVLRVLAWERKGASAQGARLNQEKVPVWIVDPTWAETRYPIERRPRPRRQPPRAPTRSSRLVPALSLRYR